MLKNEDLILDNLAELVKITNKSNELKEFELQAKSREIFALEKKNNINEEYYERMLKVSERENKLKEREIEAKEKSNQLKDKELRLKERELRFNS